MVKLVEAERETGAELVILPELWVAGGFDYKNWSSHAEPIADSQPIAASGEGAHPRGRGP